MTMELSLPSPSGFSESSTSFSDDWASLPPSFDTSFEDSGVPEPGEGESAKAPDADADAPICPVCDRPIMRDPSWKRMHKYHDECRPTGKKTGATEGTGRGGTGKAEKEADAVVKMLRKNLARAAMFIGMVDKFDGMVILVNLDSVCENFRAILLRYESFRKECLSVEGGGSIFGLVITGLMIALPIMANHGMLPTGAIRDSLMDLPFILFKMSQRMKDSEEDLSGYMADQFAEYNRTHPRGGGQTVKGETVKNGG